MTWKRIAAYYDPKTDTMNEVPRRAPKTPTYLLGQPEQQYGKGRKCKTCNATLSIYNPLDHCRSHDLKLEKDETPAVVVPSISSEG